MSELLKSVFSLSVSAVPVILVVMAGRLILSFAPKKYSYALWSVVAFRLCVPFSFKSHFSFRALGQNIVALFEKGSEGQNITPSLPPLTESVTELVPPAPAVTAPAVDSMGIAETLPVIENTSRVVSFSDILPTLLAALWIVGIAVFLILGVVSYVKLKRSVADAIRTEGRIYIHRDVTSPFVIGILKPRVILPEGLDNGTAEAVLAHENCHIRRGDHIIKTVAFLILSVHWFNPFCYLAFFLMSRDMEMSCDEKVLASMDHPDKRKEYSMAILKTATRNKSIVSTVSFGAVGIKKRIKCALDYKKPSLLVTALSLILLAVMLFGCAADAPVESNNETKAPNTEVIPEASVITLLDDVVTRALLEEEHINRDERYYSCRSHAILKTYENSEDSTVSVMVLMPYEITFDPITGERYSCLCAEHVVLIKFKKVNDSYEKLSYFDLSMSVEEMLEEFGKVIEKDEALKEYFPSEDIEALNAYISDVEYGKYYGKITFTPYRYEKDGELVEVDFSQRLRYYGTLIDAVLDSDESYDDPEDYITENAEAFETLISEWDTYELLIDAFMEGNNDGDRGYVMYRALEEYLKADSHCGLFKHSEPFEFDPTDERGRKNGQLYFDTLLRETLKEYALRGNAGMESAGQVSRRILYRRYTDTLSDTEFAELDHLYDLPDNINVCYNGERVVLEKGTADYYYVFRETSLMFADTSDAEKYSLDYHGTIATPTDEKIKEVFDNEPVFYDTPYAEFVYGSAAAEYVFGCNGDMIMVLRDDGAYDLYRNNGYSDGNTVASWIDVIEKN